MSLAQPDKQRRLLPRWRSPLDAAVSGELTPLVHGPSEGRQRIPSSEFDGVLLQWERKRTPELASEAIESALALGREDEVREIAARVIDDPLDLKPEVRRLASRVLSICDTSGQPPMSSDLHVDIRTVSRRIADLKMQAKRDPRSALTWIELARHHTILGQIKSAQRCISAALALAPDNRFVARSSARFFVHTGDPEGGLHVVQRSLKLSRDPWLMAAEISLTEVAGRQSLFAKRALEMSSTDRLHPWHTSELNGALAGLVAKDGNLKRAKRLIAQSMRVPTENAIAQAQWAAGATFGPDVSDVVSRRQDAFEAHALFSRDKGDWEAACRKCRQWSNFEPTSTRPLVLGSFIALTALDDPIEALAFLDRAILTEPNDAAAHNNRAVALALLGRLKEAKHSLERAVRLTPGAHNNPVLTATGALLLFRSGRVSDGLHEYRRAAELAVAQRDGARLALILWHLLRELAPHSPKAVTDAIPKLADRTKSVRVPELSAMRSAIEKTAAQSLEAPNATTDAAQDLSRLLALIR